MPHSALLQIENTLKRKPMKRTILLLMMALFAQAMYAQTVTLSVGNKLDVPFSIFIDDVLQNDRPVKSIAINDIPMGMHKISIVLDDAEHHFFGQHLYLTRGDLYYNINNKGSYYGWETTRHDIRPESSIALVTEGRPAATPYSVMSDPDFEQALHSLALESYDNTRLTLAKQIVSKNLLKVSQVVEICKLFSFESNKLDFAKYAYPFCRDKNKYYMVNSVFNYDASKRDLDVFIKGQP